MNDNEKTLDDIGVEVVPRNENTVDYYMRELIEYAKLKGKEPDELTPEEIAMFIRPKE